MRYLPVINRTEGREMCASAQTPAPMGASPEEMEAILLGEVPPAINPVDTLRQGLMGFILDHWRTLRAQLSCPASSGDPRSCFSCPDIRVLSCVSAQNDINKEKILTWTSPPSSKTPP